MVSKYFFPFSHLLQSDNPQTILYLSTVIFSSKLTCASLFSDKFNDINSCPVCMTSGPPDNKSAHKCAKCRKPVHSIGCSVLSLHGEEGSGGSDRICLECNRTGELFFSGEHHLFNSLQSWILNFTVIVMRGWGRAVFLLLFSTEAHLITSWIPPALMRASTVLVRMCFLMQKFSCVLFPWRPLDNHRQFGVLSFSCQICEQDNLSGKCRVIPSKTLIPVEIDLRDLLAR